MYTMKQICKKLGMTYETLRFYCDEGLVPHVKRDKKNYRSFDERNLNWLESLQCLKRCGMGISDMKKYMDLCLQGSSSIPERKQILSAQKNALLEKIAEIYESIRFIEAKQEFYDGVLAKKVKYTSNLIDDG